MAVIQQKLVNKQIQKLSPQQIQMIKLLELPTVQLEQRVRREIEDNPILEEEHSSEEGSGEENMSKEVSMEEYLREDDIPSYKLYTNNFSRDDKQRQVIITEGGRSLQDYLGEQLRLSAVSEKELAMAQYIVGNIDDDGYLRFDLQAVADDIAFSTGIDVPMWLLEKGLRIVQSLEPVGVGARDLQECLSLQLAGNATPTSAQRLAKNIIDNYFTEFSKKHFDKLISRLGVNEKQFKEALEEIHRLNPRPGFNEGGSDGAPYITPDFIIDFQDGQFSLKLNSYNVPELKVNRKYAEMIRRMSNSGSDADREAMQFVKSKIDSAKWFISAIKQRQDTLLRTMQAILDYQREYFTEGDESKLKPMILKDIADLTMLDVSTISRVVNSKYAQTHFGVISLKQLFSEAMQTDSGEEVSSHEIKNFLKKCIEEEDKRKPLTDEALMDMLNDVGYHIARRTVAKYREMLDIPVARLRKEL